MGQNGSDGVERWQWGGKAKGNASTTLQQEKMRQELEQVMLQENNAGAII